MLPTTSLVGNFCDADRISINNTIANVEQLLKDDPTISPVLNAAIEIIKIDKRRLPKGTYVDAGFEVRQVIDIHIERCVTEYRAQVLQNANGQRFVAEFPPEVTRPTQ